MTQRIPLYVIFLISICWQVYLLTNHFRNLSRRGTLFIKLTTPYCFTSFLAIFVATLIYPMYNKQTERGKLLIALFSPLFGVIFKVASRLCTQGLKKIVHPGYSYILLAPLYFGSAVIFRAIRAQISRDIVRLFGQFVVLCRKKTCLTSRLRAIRFSFPAL